MLRAKKTEIVDSLRGVFSDAGVVVVTHYQGMSVAEVTELRRGMRAAGARFRVTKNRLAKIALADTPYASLAGLFTGPTAIAFSSDPVAAPKAAVGYAKRNEKLAIIGGALGGSLLARSRCGRSPICPRSTRCGRGWSACLTTPAARLVSLLQAPGGQLARVLAAHAEQGGRTDKRLLGRRRRAGRRTGA